MSEKFREAIKSRRYNITIEEEITERFNQIATDRMEMSESGLVVIDKLKFIYDDRYDPTCGGSLNYLNGRNSNERVSTSKIRMTNALSIPFGVYVKSMSKVIQTECTTTKVSRTNSTGTMSIFQHQILI